MKFFLITMVALVGLAAAIEVPDSATQGPNPQDIATPEPEYIDIDEPEPGTSSGPAPLPQQAPAPVPIQSRNFVPMPARPIQRPISHTSASSNARLIAQSYSSPQRQYQPIGYHVQQPIFQHQQIAYHQPIMHHQPILQHHQIAYQQPILQQHHYQPIVNYHSQQQLPGHSYSSQSGYQYRRPVYQRRIYRHRY